MILVTGGTGLVGSYILLQLVRKNKNIRALIRKNAPTQEVYNLFKLYEPKLYQELYNTIEWTEGDILDIPSLENSFTGVSQVYHVAGKVSFEEKEAKELYMINVEGTKNMVNLAIDNKIEKFCFISSISALDPQLNEPFITETAEWNFKTIHSSYACSKYGAEMEVWRASQEGLNVIVVSPGIILGSGNWERSSGLLYDMAMRNTCYYTSGTTGYVDAEDVAEICIWLMTENITNEKYILVSENYSYKKIFEILRNQFQKNPAKLLSDFWLNKASIISRILPIKKKISIVAVLALTGNSEYSNQKVKTQLNYNFIPIEESLKKHSKNYLSHKQKNND